MKPRPRDVSDVAAYLRAVQHDPPLQLNERYISQSVLGRYRRPPVPFLLSGVRLGDGRRVHQFVDPQDNRVGVHQ